MIAPSGFEKMSDEELLAKLQQTYDKEAAQYILEVLRGRIKPEHPLS